MIATLIQVSVMRSREWRVDVRLLSFAREGAQVRGLLVLKTGWAGFDYDRPPQRRLYGNLLWRFRFDLPLARRDKRSIAYVSMREAYMEMTGDHRQPAESTGALAVVRYGNGVPMSREFMEDNGIGEPATRQPAEPQDAQAGNPKEGEPCTVSKSLPSLSGSPCSTSSGGSGSSVSGAPGEGALGALTRGQQALVDNHRAMFEALGADWDITGGSPFDDEDETTDL